VIYLKIKDIAIEIDEKRIANLLGYKNTIPGKEITKQIQKEIQRAKNYFKPEITYRKVDISNIQEDTVILDNGINFQGKYIANKLKGCSFIAAYVATIGKEIDEQVKESFDSGNFTLGLILDYIATEGLNFIGKVLWEKLVDEISGTNMGITSGIFPGNNLELTEQFKIFECLKGIDIGVILNDSSVMLPVKSQSGIYGFGEGIGIHRIDHVCSECQLKSCNYRNG
jgi:hypothetical protein